MKKISSPSIIKSVGNKPKVIEEYVGRVNSGTNTISIAKMSSPSGWKEPGQKPQFDEYTIVLRGILKVESRTETLFIKEGEAVIVNSGEWVQYSTPNEGAEYIAICLPAFSLDTVNRD
ncbi:MAG: cupin domain-containing protein [Candidatus Neomarinimicrobiota bacterium]